MNSNKKIIKAAEKKLVNTLSRYHAALLKGDPDARDAAHRECVLEADRFRLVVDKACGIGRLDPRTPEESGEEGWILMGQAPEYPAGLVRVFVTEPRTDHARYSNNIQGAHVFASKLEAERFAGVMRGDWRAVSAAGLRKFIDRPEPEEKDE